LPSHVTIFTGMLPADTGIRDNVGNRLSESIPTLPDLLKKNGYATGGAVSAFVLRRDTGFGRGFDFFDDSTNPILNAEALGRIQRNGRETLQAIRPWLDKQGAQPFFLFLHLYDPHTPYEPPEPFFSKYQDHYDGEIAYSDSIVGDLIADLKKKDLYDKSLIILLSDHGEGLSEHGEEEHGIFLYREDLQVPLMVKLPDSRRAGSSVSVPVQLLDVFPTILERTATPPPQTGKRPGQSLLTFLDGGGGVRPIYSESYYPRFHFGWSDTESLIDGNDHFIRAPIPELYNMASDPGEKKNVVQENRRAYVKLRAAIEPMIKDSTPASAYDPEEAAKLAALGYVGSTVSTKPGAELPDPKTTIEVFREIRLAYTYYKEKNLPEAFTRTNKLLASNAQIVDLWDLKSKILYNMGQHQAALESAKEGLRQNPGAIAILFDVANLSLSNGDLDGAQQHAELAVKIEPGQAHEILSRVWVERHNPEKAEQEAKLAMQTVPDPTTELMILAGIEMDRANYQKAINYLDQAAVHVKKRTPPKLLNLHLTRGDALARIGRGDESEREFRAEISDFPTDPRPYSSLIMLLATERRIDDATKVVFEAIQASPNAHTFAIIAETLKAIGDDRGALYWTYQGLQRFPQDAELKAMPKKLAAATPILRSNLK
jgi:tetratricopeptide (TPR) repeat protein